METMVWMPAEWFKTVCNNRIHYTALETSLAQRIGTLKNSSNPTLTPGFFLQA
jgi:hypothetical protein